MISSRLVMSWRLRNRVPTIGMLPSQGIWLRALMLLSQALTAAVEWQRTLHEERLKEHITERVHAQSVRLDLAFYE